MTAGAMLEMFKATIKTALPEWTVLSAPAGDPDHKQADMYLDNGDYGGFLFGGAQVQERVVIRFNMLVSGRHGSSTTTLTAAESYHALLEARDTAIKAIILAAQTYSNAGLIFFPQNQRQPQGTAPGVVMRQAGDKQHWQAEVSFPLERKL